MSSSLISDKRECVICGYTEDLHRHHIYYGRGRKKISEREGAWCYLCAYHHNMSNHGVHFDKALDDYLKERCQLAWEWQNRCTREDFIKTFGRNYL